ncbi:MAG: hypothetical protein FJX57_21450 [Alphaproteobacteria bacterium]|nr:hypothetical protein [Alphaproteobacteria bacterium]
MSDAALSSTVVIHVLPGNGDALWSQTACRAIAAATEGGRDLLAAPPRTRSRELFAAEPRRGGNFDLERGLQCRPVSLGKRQGLSAFFLRGRSVRIRGHLGRHAWSEFSIAAGK